MKSPLLDTYEQLPFPLARAAGVWVTDQQGQDYLDLYGGHAVALLGHSPKPLVDAIAEQGRRLFFYSNIARLDVRDRAAARLAEFLHPAFRNIFFCNSGAEANENALKLALRLTGRANLVSYKGAFHGRSFLANAVTDTPSNRELGAWIGDRVTFLSPNEFDELSAITDSHAAVILEPIQSIGGIITFSHEYLVALRKRCSEVGALLIYDEVQTGMGRAGLPFQAGFSGVFPDISTTAKGLASGFPLGAMFVTDELAQRVKLGDLGSTFGGGPMAMAALLASLSIIDERGLVTHAAEIGRYTKTTLETIPGVSVRGHGCLLGVKTQLTGKALVARLLERRIIAGTSKEPSVIRLLPPLVVEKEHIDVLRVALEEILGGET